MLYSLREGRTLPFKVSDSPGLPTEILRPGLQVHFLTASDDSGGQRAVQIALEPVASLDARLRYVARRAALRSTKAADTGRTKAEAAAEAAGAAQEDIAFMGAGVSQHATRGRRGPGGARRERERGEERNGNEEVEEPKVDAVPSTSDLPSTTEVEFDRNEDGAAQVSESDEVPRQATRSPMDAGEPETS